MKYTKQQFMTKYNISSYIWKNRKQDLLEWMSNFFDYEMVQNPGEELIIDIKEEYEAWRPLPRKGYSDELSKQKQEDYKNYTIAALGTEFKFNSAARIARDAIGDFGHDKYGHTSEKAVAERLVRPNMKKYGESTKEHYWVWYSTYTAIEGEALDRWKQILSEEHIGEKEAASAFYRHSQGEDISKEEGYFKKALKRFKEEFNDIPIQVGKWKVKEEG